MNASFESAADGFSRNTVPTFSHTIGNAFKSQIRRWQPQEEQMNSVTVIPQFEHQIDITPAG